MTTAYYSLRMTSSTEEHWQQISEVLGVTPMLSADHGWIYEIVDSEKVNFIDFFLDLLDGKYEQLQSVGVGREDISIWALFSYEGQMNVEFSPKHLKRLGENGIVLCVSCWEDHADAVL